MNITVIHSPARSPLILEVEGEAFFAALLRSPVTKQIEHDLSRFGDNSLLVIDELEVLLPLASIDVVDGDLSTLNLTLLLSLVDPPSALFRFLGLLRLFSDLYALRIWSLLLRDFRPLHMEVKTMIPI